MDNGQGFLGIVSSALGAIVVGYLGLRRIIRGEKLGEASNKAEVHGIEWVSEQLEKATKRAEAAERRADAANTQLNQFVINSNKERVDMMTKIKDLETEILLLRQGIKPEDVQSEGEANGNT